MGRLVVNVPIEDMIRVGEHTLTVIREGGKKEEVKIKVEMLQTEKRNKSTRAFYAFTSDALPDEILLAYVRLITSPDRKVVGF